MLTIEKTVLPSPEQLEIIIEGLRNPKNSWDKMDSHCCGEYCPHVENETEPAHECNNGEWGYCIGENDHQLMMNLAKAGSVHAKYRRMIPVFLTINAPLYWWKEFDTYKVGTVANSCSTMHKIHAKKFELDDFSREQLDNEECVWTDSDIGMYNALDILGVTIEALNYCRNKYLKTKDKNYWWQMIQLLPTSYNQKRTVMLNYEVLVGIYRDRRNHKLDEWHTFCDWIRGLPYSELITGGEDNAAD